MTSLNNGQPAAEPLANATSGSGNPPTPISLLQPPGGRSALTRYSLLNATDELEAIAKKQRPLLGHICLSTQATVVYAKPNVGKTLISLALLQEAIGTSRIEGDRCFYIAADDNPAGVLEKQRALKPYGVHVLSPGWKGFSTDLLRAEMQHMIDTKTADGSFVILDTLKKVADLMDKKSSSSFADLVRRYVLAGGSFLGLAHTNKRAGSDGRPIFGGTSDIVDDFDCAYTIMEVPQSSNTDERVVEFDCIKRRGNVAPQVAYRYSTKGDLSYVELLDTVQEVSADDLERVNLQALQEADAEGIDAIKDCIREGITSKQEIKKEAARRARTGQHKISDVIDRYAGPDPSVHLWHYDTYDRGRRYYWLHGEGDPSRIF
jgi:hypothetical protein